jgi:hypothetical protein
VYPLITVYANPNIDIATVELGYKRVVNPGSVYIGVFGGNGEMTLLAVYIIIVSSGLLHAFHNQPPEGPVFAKPPFHDILD